MSDGIHIPAGVVRLVAAATVAFTAYVIYQQIPEARRYLKIEAM